MEEMPQQSRATILVVDDEKHIVRLICKALERAGYAAAFAYDGQEALDWLAENPPPDIIVLDIMMPRVDGFQVMERLRKDPNLAPIPVIVLSSRGAWTVEDERAFWERIGIQTFLYKPFQPAELLDVIGKRLAGLPTPYPPHWRTPHTATPAETASPLELSPPDEWPKGCIPAIVRFLSPR